jgi:hypothetical protein
MDSTTFIALGLALLLIGLLLVVFYDDHAKQQSYTIRAHDPLAPETHAAIMAAGVSTASADATITTVLSASPMLLR